MRLFSAMAASASGLTTERLRMDLISENLANLNTTRTAAGGPYRRHVAVTAERAPSFAEVLGEHLAGRVGEGVEVVRIAEDPAPFKLKYDPGHPDAGPDGFVRLPNVDVLTEMVDLVAASRSYEANVTAFNAAKGMALKALEIGRS